MAHKDKDNLRGFTFHGVEFNTEVGNQSVGDCPFCGKENKFYANSETRLWDCKVCQKHGNFEDFLAGVLVSYQKDITQKDLKRLAGDRDLPVEAFEGLGIGFDAVNRRFIVPIYSAKLRIQDLRYYKIGGRIMSSPTVNTGLYRMTDLMAGEKKDEPIYLCEGEWDTIAWRWLLRKAEKPGVCVGVPGAGTFKDGWVEYFDKRQVYCLYDNDQAGIDGEVKVQNKIGQLAASLTFTHWPPEFKEGYDINNLVTDLAAKEGKPKKTYKFIHSIAKTHPRSTASYNPSGDENNATPEPPQKLDPISVEELQKEYSKWLTMTNFDAITIIYATLIANKIPGDPLWMFLIAPPGGSKSEFLMSLSASDYIHALTSLTPHTLISGASFSDGKDPSLLPQLNKRVLVIKDFTTILTMHYSVRDEIFGVLRDVYDGSIEKPFGNGVRRRYNVRFGVLAGVTPVIETFNREHQSLGERFLKFRITGNWDQKGEEDKVRKALSNIGKAEEMRADLKKAAARYIKHIEVPKELPKIGETMTTYVVHLAKFAARLRGVVERDKFDKTILYKPSSEVPTRLALQLTRLGMGIAIFLGRDRLDESAYRLMRRCALDTVPDKFEEITRALWEMEQGREGQFVLTKEIVNYTRLSQSTIFRALEDLVLMRIVDKNNDTGQKSMWKLSAYIKDLINKGRIYDRTLDETKKKFVFTRR